MLASELNGLSGLCVCGNNILSAFEMVSASFSGAARGATFDFPKGKQKEMQYIFVQMPC